MREGRAAVRRRVRDKRESGASLVEFAFVVPILAMFLFGIVQFGIAYDAKQAVNSGSREGARFGALQTTTLGEIRGRSIDTYGSSAAPGADPTVEIFGVVLPDPSDPTSVEDVDDFSAGSDSALGPCGSTSTDYDFVRVALTKPYELTIPFVPLDPVDLKSTGEFRCE